MKKNDPEHYLTDALVTSDEWDSFDYNLRMQIKELGQIDYNSTSIDWKKNTLAFGYLYHVEKLLLEKNQCENFGIENIRELQTLIKTYDHLKTFLLTLRILTLAYRAGLIPEFVTHGKNFRKDQSKKGSKLRGHDGKTAADLQTRNNLIIEDFKKALRKNPRLTPSAFAQKYAANYNLKSRRIWDLLKMAVGN